jgi:hypothetical protein
MVPPCWFLRIPHPCTSTRCTPRGGCPGPKVQIPGLSRWFGEGSRVVLQNLCTASRPHCAVGGKGQSEHVLSARLMTAAEPIAFPARSPQRRRRAAGMTRYPREGSTAISPASRRATTTPALAVRVRRSPLSQPSAQDDRLVGHATRGVDSPDAVGCFARHRRAIRQCHQRKAGTDR